MLLSDNNAEPDRIPLYLVWTWIHVDFRAVLLRSVTDKKDRIDFVHASRSEWVDLPDDIRARLMLAFKANASDKWRALSEPGRDPHEWAWRTAS